MDIYVAVLHDRHSDDVIELFLTLDDAIACCKDWLEDEVDIQETPQEALRGSWLYYATYGIEEIDDVHVEKHVLHTETEA